MRVPRFRQYANLTQTASKGPSQVWPVVKKIFILFIAIVMLAGSGWVLMRIIPKRNSIQGEYTPPLSRTDIVECSQARWILQDTHSEQLGVYLGWYYRKFLMVAKSPDELDQSGFRPFIFNDEAGEEVKILPSGDDFEANNDLFLFMLIPPEGTTGGFISKRTLEQSNFAGQVSHEVSNETVYVNSEDKTSIHAQFLPQTPEFQEEYICFLAQAWEYAVSGYVALYQHPPENLDDLLDGIGLEANPDCEWPFGARERIRAKVEGGIINGKIIYWQLTLMDGSRYGQARYWDHYTIYDDPDTPVNIITDHNNSPVVDPSEIRGTRQVMFNLDIMKNLLEEARAAEIQGTG